MKDKCVIKRCRGVPILTWLGMRVCERHWSEHCLEVIDLKGVN